jgi:hypothetical protein
MRPLKYFKPPTTVLKHFRHKGQSIELPLLVQRLENLFLAPDLDPLANVVFHIAPHSMK